MQLFRKIGTFRGEAAFSTWLHRLAFNIVLMRLRRHSYQAVSLYETPEPGADNKQTRREIGSRDLHPSGSVDRLDLERVLEQLPSGYKEIFILRDVEGYEHHEIASVRGCSLGNSKSQLHKARTRLRQLLQPGGGERDQRVENTEALLETVSMA
jgi:RNA polymerase sigma-70 factor (ECF subfamily)